LNNLHRSAFVCENVTLVVLSIGLPMMHDYFCCTGANMHEIDEQIYREELSKLRHGGPVTRARCKNERGVIPFFVLELMVKFGDAVLVTENETDWYKAVEPAK
jgi:hypothetical protein